MASPPIADNKNTNQTPLNCRHLTGKSSVGADEKNSKAPMEATLQQMMCSPYIGIYPFETTQSAEKRAAAAAARRKRRTALIRRSKSPKALASKGSTAKMIAVQVPISITLPNSLGTENCDATCKDVFIPSDSRGNMTIKVRNKKVIVLPATIDGVQSIATRLYEREEIVAIPTECTYELLVKLEWIGNKGRLGTAEHNHKVKDQIKEIMKYSERTTKHASKPSLNRQCQIEDVCNDDYLEPVSFPVCARRRSPSSILDLVKSDIQVNCSQILTPHLYFHSVNAIEKCDFLKQQLPKKSYAIKISTVSTSNQPGAGRRNSTESSGSGSCNSSSGSGSKAVLATFNESMAVLQRLAKYLWPSPIKLYVAVPEPTTISIESPFCHGHYLGLRCPSHPLTIKVLQEFERISSLKAGSRRNARSIHGLFPQHISASPQEQDSDRSSLPSLMTEQSALAVLFGVAMVNEKSVSCNSDGNHEGCSPTAASSTEPTISMKSNFTTNASEVAAAIDSSSTLPNVSAILNGEEKHEMFSVPTCEYGEPCTASVWIDASKRVITVHRGNIVLRDEPYEERQEQNYQTSRPHKRIRYASSPHSVTTTNDEEVDLDDVPDIDLLRTSPSPSLFNTGDSKNKSSVNNITSSSLLHALHGFKPKSLKERVVKSVLMRWKVVLVNDGDKDNVD